MQVNTHLVSQVFYARPRRDPLRREMIEYIRGRIVGADRGSLFERRIRLLRWVPLDPLMRGLFRWRYDGMLLAREQQIVCSCFFQRHGDALHGFSFFTDPAFRGQGLAHQIVDQFIAHGQSQAGINKVRIGAGGSEILMRAYERLRERHNQNGILVNGGGWVEFVKSSADSSPTDHSPRHYS